MTILLLIRHAENDYISTGRLAGRLAGVHLNDKGRQQAEALAVNLKNLKLQAIFSSPLERALETATPLARMQDLPVFHRSELSEVDFGEWQDKALEQLRSEELWKHVIYLPSQVTFPNGESYAQAQHRIQQALSQIAGEYAEKDLVACFSHADMIKLAVAYFIGLPMDMFQRLHISPGSITVLSLTKAGASLHALNIDSTHIISLD